MNVLKVSRLYPRPADPVLGVFVEEEAKELARHCNIRVVSPAPWFPPLKLFRRWYQYSQLPLRETRTGVDVLRPRTVMLPRNLLFPLLGFSFYLTLRRLTLEMRGEFPIHLIHAHTAYPDGFAAVKLGRALGFPTVITLHGGDVTTHFRQYSGRKLGLWAITNADRVVAVSNSLRDIVVDGHGADGEKITVIPNGVNVTRFAPMPQAEARQELRLHGEAPMVLYVGALARSKGIEHLLRALKLLDGDQGASQLVLVGDGEYEQSARRLTEELGIARSVVFAGKRPHHEMPLWMNACDVLTLPSLSEGFGVALIEAMACGKPVVATLCGGPEDIVTPQTGILVPPGDEQALAGAMQEALVGRGRFHPEVVRQHVLDHFSHDVVTPRILDLYREVLRL